MLETIDANTLQNSQTFLKTNFYQYYQNNSITLPDRFGRREYAFVLFNSRGMIRHLGFNKSKEFHSFIQQRIPCHAYYSSAYYQQPNAPTMQEKKWLGAELIFDLDSDHLPNAQEMTYEESLKKVKSEFIKLVEEFLLGDFGFNSKYLELYFSGGRGYHCHVKHPAIFDLDSNERRELVDYITGRDLQDHIIFREHATDRKTYGRRTYVSGKSLHMPTPDETGWRGRISRGIIDLINEILQSNDPIAKLLEYGVKPPEAQKLVQELSEARIKRIKDGILDQSKTIRKFFLNRALRKTAVDLTAGETDEPVTCDVKRLIRLPNSLHGKTGFLVKQISIHNLKNFNPLNDAIVFNDDPIEITIHKPLQISLHNQHFSLTTGEHELPRFLAIFLIARKIATILTPTHS